MSQFEDFFMRKGDLTPVLRMEFKDDDDNVIDLTGASIVFNYRLKKTGSMMVSRVVSIENATAGSAQYAWESADTAIAGVFVGEFIITFSDGNEMTFPRNDYLIWEILDDIHG